MYICVECAIEMYCQKNSVGADFGHGHTYAGDVFKCDSCGQEILATNECSNHDPNYRNHDQYLRMRDCVGRGTYSHYKPSPKSQPRVLTSG